MSGTDVDVDWTGRSDGAGLDALDPLRPIARRSAADQVFDRLVTAFALALYPPTHRLPAERELAERLGVSRVTVREALGRLEGLGYVETRRGRYGGTFVASVAPPGSGDIVERTLRSAWSRFEELFDVSRQLLPVIGRLAAERRTRADLARLDDARAQYEDARNREAARAADGAFHAAVALATHNSILAAAAEQVRRQLTLGVDAFPYSVDIHARAAREHVDIVAAMRAGAGERVAELLVGHFVELAEHPFRQVYRGTGLHQPEEGDA